MSNSGGYQVRILKLLRIYCRWCSTEFYVCQSCWRRQAYCQDACRVAGRLKSHRKAQKRYRQTQRGKKVHCLAENRRRLRKINMLSKNMDDATSRCTAPGFLDTSLIFRQPWVLGLQARIPWPGLGSRSHSSPHAIRRCKAPQKSRPHAGLLRDYGRCDHKWPVPSRSC